ncbi:23593_t:CDS:1 [Gigaspora margarita]|uniref:23593_t:CDS:1 n=1 Tax=Gigaspora margarita TaxID=4874 RepID=A0ABN7WDU4_GIGMA|nr:23593_t:CDS:1 [Gigaspora margarita]
MNPHKNQLSKDHENADAKDFNNHVGDENSVTEGLSVKEPTAGGKNGDATNFQAENSATVKNFENNAVTNNISAELSVIEENSSTEAELIGENGDVTNFQAENPATVDNFENDTVVESPVVEDEEPAANEMFPFCPNDFPENVPIFDQYIRDLISLL